VTLIVALGMREPGKRTKSIAPTGENLGDLKNAEITAWHLVLNAGAWIVRTPVALFVIVAGVLMDSVVRLFLTFSSSYFRLIELPSASYGFIGAGLGALGFVVAPAARRLVRKGSAGRNFALA